MRMVKKWQPLPPIGKHLTKVSLKRPSQGQSIDHQDHCGAYLEKHTLQREVSSTLNIISRMEPMAITLGINSMLIIIRWKMNCMI
jgi:hypothetical protein